MLMKWYDAVNLWLYILCAPIDQIFIWSFGFAPDVLRMICASMLVLTIGKILDFYKRKTYQIVKLALYAWFFIYTLYCLDFITEFKNYDSLDWGSIAFGLIAPISLFILGYIFKGKFRALFHFDFYYVLMSIYFILGCFWFAYRPAQINFSMYSFFWGVLLLGVYVFSHITKGILDVSGDEKASLWTRFKIVSKLIFFTVIYTIVEEWLIALNNEAIVENWVIGISGLLPCCLLTMMYYRGYKKQILVFFVFFFFSWLMTDAEDFVLFISTLLGFVLFLIVLGFCAYFMVLYKKRAEILAMAFLFTIVYCAIFAWLFALNNEKIVENWVIGLFFTILFCVLYLLPAGKFWLLIKKFHVFMIIFWLSWFLIDLNDFVTTIIKIYG